MGFKNLLLPPKKIKIVSEEQFEDHIPENYNKLILEDITGESPKEQLIEQPEIPKNLRTRAAKYTVRSTTRLRQLGFDPLEKMVKLYEKISGEIIWMERLRDKTQINKDGSERRYSPMTHANLLTLQQKLITDLMRYGYARVPETVIEEKPLHGITINLTPKGGLFVPDLDTNGTEDEDD